MLPTGTGKSRVGVEVLRELGSSTTALVIVPKVNLKEQWKEEFERWGVETSNITFECINTAAKWQNYFDLVIVDEAHRSTSPTFGRLYDNLSYKFLVCLTATEPREDERRTFLYSKAPLVYKKEISDSLSAGVVAPFDLYNLAVPMSREVLHKYNAFNRQFNEGAITLASLRRNSYYLSMNFASSFDIARHFSKGGYIPGELDSVAGDLVRACKQFWSGMTLRKQVLYTNPSKLTAVTYLLNKYKGKKWIIFTKNISLAKQLSEIIVGSRVYHSKLKKKEREEVLSSFSSCEFTTLIAVDALNEGLNVSDVDAAISVSGSSTELEQIQRLGRCIRVANNKRALFFNLYVPGTPEERWATERTKNLNPKWITMN